MVAWIEKHCGRASEATLKVQPHQQNNGWPFWRYSYIVKTAITILSETIYVTLDQKNSLKCQFIEIEIYTTYESWINQLSIDVWFVRIELYLVEIQLFENLGSEGVKISKYWENRL